MSSFFSNEKKKSISMPECDADAFRACLERLVDDAQELGIQLMPEKAKKLMDFVVLLKKWNTTHNLTSNDSWNQVLTHHLLDSLSVLSSLDPLIDDQQQQNHPLILDVGSGAGLPGLVLAIMRPDYRVVLIDPVRKKTVFQKFVIASLGLKNVISLHQRVEDVRPKAWQAFSKTQYADLIISRAFAVQSILIQLSGHLLKSSGGVIAMRGKIEGVASQEWIEGWRLTKRVPLFVPGLNAERHLNIWHRETESAKL